MLYTDIMKKCVEVKLERTRRWQEPPSTWYNYRVFTQAYVPGTNCRVPKYLKERWIELALYAAAQKAGVKIIKSGTSGLVIRRKGTDVWETPVLAVVEE